MEVGFKNTGTRFIVNGLTTSTLSGLTPSGSGFYVTVGPYVEALSGTTRVSYDNVVVSTF